jgi:hypothetical protein
MLAAPPFMWRRGSSATDRRGKRAPPHLIRIPRSRIGDTRRDGLAHPERLKHSAHEMKRLIGRQSFKLGLARTAVLGIFRIIANLEMLGGTYSRDRQRISKRLWPIE